MEIYFDNAATTKPSVSVLEAMQKVLTEDYGNPSSMHRMGFCAEQHIKEAAGVIAKSLHAAEKEIVFTSGGTESNNMALIGTALANQRSGKHIITTQMEHAAVYNPLLFLEEMGFEITFLPVDSMGHVSPAALQEAVREDTILVSIMYVNNEIGAVNDIAALSRAAKEKNPRLLFHVDAIQAYGKYKISPAKEGIDLLSVSGHKIHGPKGTGFLYIRDKVKIKPVIYGGGQQGGLRSGTENVPGIVGLGVAAKEAYQQHGEKRKKLFSLKKRLMDGLSVMEGVFINAVSGENLQAPHILSASFPGIRSEVLLHALEDKGIYVSAGSACSSNHPGISGTLKAAGLSEESLTSTLRFSFSVYNTEEEADETICAVQELLPMLKRYTRY